MKKMAFSFALLLLSSPSFSSNVLSENKAIINQFKFELEQRLTFAINEDGPAEAISVCAKEAPIITAKLSKEYGVDLKRVSKKYRNPKNKAFQEYAKIIEYFEKNPESTNTFFNEGHRKKLLYAQPIKTGAVCLTCHGETISKDVTAALKTYYPKDLATGYELGDLRGIFVIERNLGKDLGLEIKNFRVLSEDLWVGGQPSIEELEKLKALGVKTIINLRSESEMTFNEVDVTKRFGFEYISIPISGSSDITFQNSDYLRSKLKETDGPVFVHCASSNRVGALLALDARKNGSTIEESLEIGRAGGMKSLEKVVSGILQKQ